MFFAVLFLLGCFGLWAFLVYLVLPEWRVNHDFVEHACELLDTRVRSRIDTEGLSGDGLAPQSASEDAAPMMMRPEVRISYEVDGIDYVVWTYDIATAKDLPGSYSSVVIDEVELARRFVPGTRGALCWYDPDDPNIVVLVRGYSWWMWVVLVIPVSFVIIGSGRFVYAILHGATSAERRAAITQRVRQHDLLKAADRSTSILPNIPDGDDITNSPGTTLRYRLPSATSSSWFSLGMVLACVVCNGIVWVFAAMAVVGHVSGAPDWYLTLFVLPFVLLGALLIVVLARRLAVATATGPTLAEISAHPLIPGKNCRLFISQAGRLKFRSLSVSLVCEEEATFRQGTNTRTETREVYRSEVLRRDRFEIRRGVPFEAECDLTIPCEAMHSFKAKNNEINWRIVVEGVVTDWPRYTRTFPVVVQPSTINHADGNHASSSASS